MKTWILIFGCITSAILTVDSFKTIPDPPPPTTPPPHTLVNGQTFDFIVVGGGVAGCAISARLAENGKYNVLLITEGGLPHPDFDVPAVGADFDFISNPEYAKFYRSIPQRNAALAQGGNVTFIIGKPLGGGSAINGMFLNRGHPQDYNNWARETGDDSWSYSKLLKYFRKYETYVGDNPSDQRGFHGPITVSRPKYAPGLSQWLQGGKQLGYDIGDPNGPQTESFNAVEYTKKFGRRVSSYKGYIEPMFQSIQSKPSKPNLVMLLDTIANHLLFEHDRVVGVKFTSNSTGKEVVGYAKATKEVIVTAGVMDSPAFLMRSGIGEKSMLEKLKIPVIKDLPVGRNLQDHAVSPIIVVFGNRSLIMDPERDLTPQARKIYDTIGDGPYSSTLGSGGQAFLTSSVLSPYEKVLAWPDLHLAYSHSPSAVAALPSLPAPNDLKKWEAPVMWTSILVRPQSRGCLELDPRNINNPPLIDFQFLSHPEDVRALIDGIKVLLKLCEHTSAFQQVGCRVPTTPISGCSRHKFRSDAYWKCYAEQMVTTTLHAAGSCKMGKGPKDPEAVVDPELKVIGIEGLRVADASIMPAVTNANTQGAVYVIAEKAADMILKTWSEGDSSSSKIDGDAHPHHGHVDIWSLLRSKFDTKV